MYGQNNYGPQFGQGPRTPMPPANQQRAPALPPPPPQPPLQYQQGPRAPQPPVIQQTTYPIPPQIGQRGPYSYQNGFPAPPPTVQQSPSIAFHGMPNTGQSYLHPPPPAHGSTLVSQCYSNAQHNVQHPSHTGTQNLHPIPPPALVPPHGPPPCPDMLQAAAPHGSLPPPPPRPLPPPPPAGTQGLTLYKALYSPQSQTSGAEGLQHVPPPPPPPASNLFTPSTYGSSVNVTVGDSHVPPMDPLQQASRLPPSPSLPTAQSPSSSWPDVTASSFHCHPDFDHSSNKLPVSELKDPDSVDEVTASSHVRRITAVDGASQNYEGRNGFEAGSLAGDGLSSNKSLMFDLSSPPPKPVDAKINQKIEFLCQLIANNGPGTEDVTRQNESKNPEFEFLFGGAPGSGAAIAHEYFLWMKKRCMACKLNEGKNESPLKSLVIDSSSQPDHMMVSSGCVSLADSDMEMEDDITLPDRDQGVNDLIHEELDVKKQLHGPHSSPERSAAQGASCEKVSCSLSSEQCKGTNLVSDKGRAIIEKLPPIVDSLYSTGAAECPLVSNLENSSIPVADDQITFGAPAVAEANNSDRLSDQFIKIGSPFRLLQDYASDNSSENEDEAFVEDANVVIVPPLVTSVGKSSDKETGSHFMTYIGFESPCMTERESMPPTESRKSYKAAKFSQDTKKEVKDTCTTLISIESHEAFQEKDASDSAGIDVVSRSGKSQEGKKAKFESVPPKVDEFGRLIREGSSGSNSDDSYYKKRHNKRGRNRLRSRSRSRSRSPLKSRRRSPRRRREKRSRSRSWSSRNQRNRSRSPPFRRAGEFRDDNKRQDRGHIPECFDFLRGRCYRGASCRYVHHEYDKSDGSRRHRNKQPELKNSRIKEEIKHISVMNLHDEIKTQEMQICQDVPIPTKDGQLIDPDKTRCESSTVAAATMQVKQIISEKPEETTTHIPEKTEFQEVLKSHNPSSQLINGADSMKLCIDTSQDVLPFMKESIMEQPPSKNSVAQVQKANCSSEQMEDSTVSISEPLPNAILSTHEWAIKSANGQPISSEQFSSEFMAPNELPLPKFSAANIVYHSQLPPPPPPPPQGASAVHVSQLHRNYNMMPPHPLPNQHDQFSLPPDSSWTSLPPPPSRPLYDPSSNAGFAARGVSSQFQQNHLVPRNDIDSHTSAWPYPTELPSHSQVGDFVQQMYPPVRELPRPLLHREDFRSGNPSSQPFGGPGPMREDHFAHAPMQGLNSSNAFAHGNIHPQPAPSSRELTMHKMKNFSGDDFPKNETVNSSSQIHHGSQNQQPTYGMQYPVGDGILGVPGNSAIQYPKDLLDGNQSSCLPDFGVTTIPTHHHPYTATFEQPLSSKFSSNSLNQDKNGSSGNMFETSFIPGQVPVDGQGVGSVGSRQTTSSPSSARAVGQILRKSDGEQYDPLFDSFEPSLSPLEKHGHDQKRKRPSDSKVMVRLSGSFKPLDVEENNKHEEVGTVASATSLDNEEYGETADAEVGVVEDESPSDPDGAENFAAGEIEIDQVESSGKSKKKKDSRSMRLFKIAVADFVKEILKPSWRQGNMSKEAFKTIVKKTVDKVSGAMKRHQIPKSQAKINQYIDLSQRKLTKLVMGYVDKYVKV